MALTIGLVFLILAVICFALAAFGVQARIGWRDAGFAFVTLALIFGGA